MTLAIWARRVLGSLPAAAAARAASESAAPARRHSAPAESEHGLSLATESVAYFQCRRRGAAAAAALFN